MNAHTRLGLAVPTETDIVNTFWLTCRDRFKVLERYHRVCKRLDVTPLPPALSTPKRRGRGSDPDACHNTPGKGRLRVADDVPPEHKRVRRHNLDCSSKTPARRLGAKKDLLVCWICGYHIAQKKCVQFECCDAGKVSHTLCWRKQSLHGTTVMCSNVKHYFKRAAREPDYTVVFDLVRAVKRTREQAAADKMQSLALKLYCSTCDNMLDPNDPLTRDHLKFQCPAIPSTPLRPGYSYADLARRMAALGSKKKLHNHNFTPH